MTKKIVRAEDILKEKNFSFPPFNTNAFTDAVVSFFREHDVSAKLTLIQIRFINYEDTPSDGFFASTTPYYNKTIDDYIYPFPSFFPWRDNLLYDFGCLWYPFIFVNEVYMENAVALLKMLGFVVGRPYKYNYFKCRSIYLV